MRALLDLAYSSKKTEQFFVPWFEDSYDPKFFLTGLESSALVNGWVSN